MSGPKCSDENQTRKAAGYCPGPLVSPKYTSNKLVWKKREHRPDAGFLPVCPFPLSLEVWEEEEEEEGTRSFGLYRSLSSVPALCFGGGDIYAS